GSKVPNRKGSPRGNEPIRSAEYADLRDRVDGLRSRARGDSPGGYPPPAGTRSEPPRGEQEPGPSTSGTVHTRRPNEIPVGTEFDVRLQSPLSSKTAQVEDR